jgi:hypothetical protein
VEIFIWVPMQDRALLAMVREFTSVGIGFHSM